MNKQQLKQILLNNCKKGSTIEICFLGGTGGWNPSRPPRNKTPYTKMASSGTYIVNESKRGRGKGGSQVLTLSSTTDPLTPLFQIGTTNNQEIVYLVVNGTKHGLNDETEVDKDYTKDMLKAAALKKKLSPLLRLREGTALKLEITSPEPKFNGVFDLLTAKAMAGRWGQIKLDLKNISSGELVSLWSYRHATIVDNIVNVTMTHDP